MTSPEEIRKLSELRLEEAEVLCCNGKYDGAFYLVGYSVELALKAKICERFGISNLFSLSSKDFKNFEGLSEISRVVRTHNLQVLLVFSGLKTKFDVVIQENVQINIAYTLLINTWSENSRYCYCGSNDRKNVEKIIDILKNEEGLLKWIENN